jgi:hypothetical protein
MTIRTIHDPETPVLVIENEQGEYEQISKVLKENHYTPNKIGKNDLPKIQNYLAIFPNTQIIIVDLHLGNNIEEGWNMIRDHLWPANRTAFFIVFSSHLEENDLEEGPGWCTDGPPVWLVDKIYNTEGQFTDNCLANLLKVVDKYNSYASPSIQLPNHKFFDALIASAAIESSLSPAEVTLIKEGLHKPFLLSMDRLGLCVDVTKFFDRAGMLSKNIGVGVFGSCGRMETRPDSDIEFIVFCKTDGANNSNSILKLSCDFWNRLRLNMINQKPKIIECEDGSLLENGLLNINIIKKETADFSVLSNKFIPVLDEIVFEKAINASIENILNKTFQLLTEMQAVFNPKYIRSLKEKSLLAVLRLKSLPGVWDLIALPEFSKIFSQFEISTQNSKIEGPKDLKRFCYRTLHILSSRIELIRIRTFLDNEPSYDLFFDWLLLPPLGKLLSFHTSISEYRKKNPLYEYDKELKDTLRALKNLIVTHAEQIRRIVKWMNNGSEDWNTFAKNFSDDCQKSYDDFFNKLLTIELFDSSAKIKWLFGAS